MNMYIPLTSVAYLTNSRSTPLLPLSSIEMGVSKQKKDNPILSTTLRWLAIKLFSILMAKWPRQPSIVVLYVSLLLFLSLISSLESPSLTNTNTSFSIPHDTSPIRSDNWDRSETEVSDSRDLWATLRIFCLGRKEARRYIVSWAPSS